MPNTPLHKSAISPLVNNGFCSGCGICAAICPQKKLRMQFSAFGELTPVENNTDCGKSCSLCFTVCPFGKDAACEESLGEKLFGNEKESISQQPLGYYTALFSGHTNTEKKRLKSPSGGCASWFLEHLFHEDIVDKVICVVPTEDPEQLFKFTVFDSAEAIQKSACSSYYPVEISDALREVSTTEARYGIIGLPCTIKGLRRAINTFPKLKRRIPVLAGIACGAQQSALYTSFLVGIRGYSMRDVTSVNFRHKQSGGTARGYSFTFTTRESPDEKRIFDSELKGNNPWNLGFFKVSGCNYCDDMFCELADVSFLDAWSPEFMQDFRGHNFIIPRTELTKNIILAGQERGELSLKSADATDVIASQRPALYTKRTALPLRLRVIQEKCPAEVIPQKRLQPAKHCKLHVRLTEYLRVLLAERGKQIFCKDPSPAGLQQVWKKTRVLRMVYRIVKKLSWKLGAMEKSQ